MRRTATLLVLLAGIGWAKAAPAQETQPAAAPKSAPTGCAECHDGKADKTLAGPPHALLERSIHAGLDCTDCHQALSMDTVKRGTAKPHGPQVTPVNCAQCHEEEAKVYVKHGRKETGKDPDIPACWNCHGTHDILPSTDRQSHVNPINLPSTCRTCHANTDLVKKHEILREAPIKLYESSVHGQATQRGMNLAANCNDCHSAKDPDGRQTAHRILSAADPQSTIYHFNIPDTCGKCHDSFAKDYWEGIHGKLVKRGQVDAPVCTNCHGEHGILKPSDPRSPVSPARVAEATCSPCHESETLNEKYGIPAGRLRSYVDSYHGLKSKAGNVRVANCASCHGVHRILPHTDPTSSIYPANLQHTCGECHPGITAELANEPIHETATGVKSGWPQFFTVLYWWIIGITIGLMLLHSLADLVRHIKIMRRQPHVVRMTPNETFQHWMLTLSFIVLVISGFSLRFSESWWVKLIFGWGDGQGFLVRGTVHRVAAVVFAFCCVWHIVYLFTHRGRHALRDMLVAKRDFIDIMNSAAFFLGLRAERPRFARFSYMEKCEYWALVWGAVIMSVTGTLLWFDNYFVEHWKLPKGVLDVVLVVHYYEAWLATLAILVWHGYSTVFSPHVYPMNPAWLGGKMPKDMYTHEHPDGPKLRARVSKTFDEDDEEPDTAAPAEPPKGSH
jgi:cytochrome b subunit of formate dehydrogenase